MKTLKAYLVLAASAGALVAAGAPAKAQTEQIAFGASAYDGNETLTLSGGAPIATGGNQGWVATNDNNAPGNTNYVVGYVFISAYNNYFVFSLAGQTTPVTSATLSLSAHIINTTATYSIYDATSVAGALLTETSNPTSPNVPLFNALVSGPFIGSTGVNPGQSGGTISISLNSAGLADLNYDIANGVADFAIGGTLVVEPPPPPPPARSPARASLASPPWRSPASMRGRAAPKARRSLATHPAAASKGRRLCFSGANL